jgi:hypothetical protein
LQQVVWKRIVKASAVGSYVIFIVVLALAGSGLLDLDLLSG